MQRLGQALDQTGNGNLVAHLGLLSRAAFTQAAARLGVYFHDRQRAVKGTLVTATHDRQHTVLGPCLSARHRRIDKADLRRIGSGVELGGHLRRNGGVIDKDRAAGHPLERAIVAQADRPQVVVIAHTGHHEFGTFGRLERRFGHLAAVILDPVLRLGGGAVIDGYVVTRLCRCPAIGAPMTPNPRNASFAIRSSFYVGIAYRLRLS